MTREDLMRRVKALDTTLPDVNTRKQAVDWMVDARGVIADLVTALETAEATERKACAQVCDGVYYKNIGPLHGEVRHGIAQCAAAIRERGSA